MHIGYVVSLYAIIHRALRFWSFSSGVEFNSLKFELLLKSNWYCTLLNSMRSHCYSLHVQFVWSNFNELLQTIQNNLRIQWGFKSYCVHFWSKFSFKFALLVRIKCIMLLIKFVVYPSNQHFVNNNKMAVLKTFSISNGKKQLWLIIFFWYHLKCWSHTMFLMLALWQIFFHPLRVYGSPECIFQKHTWNCLTYNTCVNK